MDCLDDLRARLRSKDVYSLRQVGRESGISRPTKYSKEGLVEAIMDIASGKADPERRPKRRGAPPKSDYYDEYLVELVRKCREISIRGDGAAIQDIRRIAAAEGELSEKESIVAGLVEVWEGQYFVRVHNMERTPGKDVYIPSKLAESYALTMGDKVVCKCSSVEKSNVATDIISVNTLAPRRGEPMVEGENIAIYPDTKLLLGDNNGPAFGRAADLFAPVAFGQRIMIVTPDYQKKTEIVTELTRSIRTNYPNALTVVLLLNKRPEDVTYITRNVCDAEVYYTTFDKSDQTHIHIADFALKYVKRQVETGRDVVFVVDGLTTLAKSHNAIINANTVVSGAFNSASLLQSKELFAAARNIEDGSSLTVFGIFDAEENNGVDKYIVDSLSQTISSCIHLVADPAENYGFPIVIGSTGGDGREDLLSEDELKVRQIIMDKMAAGRNITDDLKKLLSAYTLADYCRAVLLKDN